MKKLCKKKNYLWIIFSLFFRVENSLRYPAFLQFLFTRQLFLKTGFYSFKKGFSFFSTVSTPLLRRLYFLLLNL